MNWRVLLGINVLWIGMLASSSAQLLDTNWVRQYDRTSSNWPVHIVDLPNGNYLLEQGLMYYEIGTNGDSITSGTFNNGITTFNEIINYDDTLYVGGELSGKPIIAQLDQNYDTIWTTSFANSSFGTGVSAILEDSGFIYVSGSYSSSRLFISKLDKSGNILWNTSLPQTTFSNLSSLIKLSDGNFLASGNLDDYPIAFKFDSTGDTLWHYSDFTFISFTEMEAFEKSNGNIVLVPTRMFIELDANGNKISDTTLYKNYFGLEEVGDTVYLFGKKNTTQWGGDQFPYAHVMNKNLDSLDSYIDSSFIHPLAYNRFSDVIQPSPGVFVAAGVIRDSINIIANTWNLYVVKFNDQGPPVSYENTVIEKKKNLIYPNPVGSQLNFTEQVLAISVFDITGKLLIQSNSNNIQTLEVTNLRSGTYFYEAILEDQSVLKGSFVKD